MSSTDNKIELDSTNHDMKQLKEYVVALEKKLVESYGGRPGSKNHSIDFMSTNSKFWDYINNLDETYILLNHSGTVLLTDKNLYLTKFHYIIHAQHMHMTKDQLEFYPIYTFDKPLTVEDLKIFNNKGFEHWFFMDISDKNGFKSVQVLKSLEIMITKIPGSYKNKGWRNICGFTGVYINDDMGLFIGDPMWPPEKEL
jgi:hypothetical protein